MFMKEVNGEWIIKWMTHQIKKSFKTNNFGVRS